MYPTPVCPVPQPTSTTSSQLLDKLHMDDRHADRPLRVPVLDRYNDRGTMVLGKVEQVRLGEEAAWSVYGQG